MIIKLRNIDSYRVEKDGAFVIRTLEGTEIEIEAEEVLEIHDDRFIVGGDNEQWVFVFDKDYQEEIINKLRQRERMLAYGY